LAGDAKPKDVLAHAPNVVVTKCFSEGIDNPKAPSSIHGVLHEGAFIAIGELDVIAELRPELCVRIVNCSLPREELTAFFVRHDSDLSTNSMK